MLITCIIVNNRITIFADALRNSFTSDWLIVFWYCTARHWPIALIACAHPKSWWIELQYVRWIIINFINPSTWSLAQQLSYYVVHNSFTGDYEWSILPIVVHSLTLSPLASLLIVNHACPLYSWTTNDDSTYWCSCSAYTTYCPLPDVNAQN